MSVKTQNKSARGSKLRGTPIVVAEVELTVKAFERVINEPVEVTLNSGEVMRGQLAGNGFYKGWKLYTADGVRQFFRADTRSVGLLSH